MSDTQQGLGWWQASNEKWYDPEPHANYQQEVHTLPPPSQQSFTQISEAAMTAATGATTKTGKQRKTTCKRWRCIPALLVLQVVSISCTSPSQADDQAATEDTTAPSQPTLDTAPAIPVVTQPAPAVTQPAPAVTQPAPAVTQPAQPAPAVTQPAQPAPAVTQPAQDPTLVMLQEATYAANYFLQNGSFSRLGLIDALLEFGYVATAEQAAQVVGSMVVNWQAEAVEAAYEILATYDWTYLGYECDRLIAYLTSRNSYNFTGGEAYGAAYEVGCSWQ